MMVWVLRSPARTVLVDAGFYRDKFVRQWKPAGFVRPSEAVAAGADAGPLERTLTTLARASDADIVARRVPGFGRGACGR